MRFTRLLRFGGHGHGAGNPAFGGFREPHVSPVYKNLSVAVGASMWLWLFYRAKQDGGVLLGLRKPWEHGDHGEHHDEGHHEEQHH